MGVSPTETAQSHAVSAAGKCVIGYGSLLSQTTPHPQMILLRPSSAPPRRSRRSVRFPQFLRALIATDLDRFAPNFHSYGIRIQLAVASRTSFLSHDFFSNTRSTGRNSRPRNGRQTLSESLAILPEGTRIGYDRGTRIGYDAVLRANDAVPTVGIRMVNDRKPRGTPR